LEEPFWKGFKDIAPERRQTLSELVGSIDAERTFGNVSSAARLCAQSLSGARAAFLGFFITVIHFVRGPIGAGASAVHMNHG
jgi:hypothetical protein